MTTIFTGHTTDIFLCLTRTENIPVVMESCYLERRKERERNNRRTDFLELYMNYTYISTYIGVY